MGDIRGWSSGRRCPSVQTVVIVCVPLWPPAAAAAGVEETQRRCKFWWFMVRRGEISIWRLRPRSEISSSSSCTQNGWLCCCIRIILHMSGKLFSYIDHSVHEMPQKKNIASLMCLQKIHVHVMSSPWLWDTNKWRRRRSGWRWKNNSGGSWNIYLIRNI